MPTILELSGAGLGHAAALLGQDVEPGIAAAGTTQAGATALTHPVSLVSTVAASAGVRLPTAGARPVHVVVNGGTNTLNVYPASGEAINEQSANAAVPVPAGMAGLFVPIGTRWAFGLMLAAAADIAALADALAGATATVKPYAIPLTDLRKTGELKDPLDDTPGSNLLGLDDVAGSVVVGTETNGQSTASASESASFLFALPAEYVAGGAVTVRVRAKVSAAREVSASVDVVAKKVGDGAVGADICATNAQDLTTAYADHDFTITPTGLVAGDLLAVDVILATDDTGGSSDGTPSIAAISVRPTVKT